jgi:hypothetical protein
MQQAELALPPEPSRRSDAAIKSGHRRPGSDIQPNRLGGRIPQEGPAEKGFSAQRMPCPEAPSTQIRQMLLDEQNLA